MYQSLCHILKEKVHRCFLVGIHNLAQSIVIGISEQEDIIDTVGNVNKEIIRKYIQEQEENDELERK